MHARGHVKTGGSVYHAWIRRCGAVEDARDDRAGQVRGRAEAWRPWIATGRRPALVWPQGLTDFARQAAQCVQEWAVAEVASGRLVPWLAIAFGCGTIIYFAAEREPAPWATAVLLGGTVLAAILCRHRSFAFATTVGIAAVAAGFATATVKREIIAHPVLSAPVWNAELAGFVEAREERERSDLPGDKGAIASALITGKRDAISTPVNEAMYVSGLAHVLSISGYHMAVVAGITFFVLRALFALMPAFSSRHPIKN